MRKVFLLLLLPLLLCGCGISEKEYAFPGDPALPSKLQISAADWSTIELLAAKETRLVIMAAKKDGPDGIMINFKKPTGGWSGPIYWYGNEDGEWRRKKNVRGSWFGPPK